MLRLSDEVKFVRGVGPHVAEMLKAKSIETAEDLLYHLPFRYEDRQNPRSLDELKPGETASVIAEVRGAMLMRTRKAPLFELTVGQGRYALKCLWFHGHYLEGKFHAGQTVALWRITVRQCGQVRVAPAPARRTVFTRSGLSPA